MVPSFVPVETSPSQLEQLRRQILAAFPHTNPPAPENITSHPCEECEGVTEDFRGVRWWCADDTLIDGNFDKLPLLTPEAHHYYLPAFVLRALAEFEPDEPVLQFCIYNLTPGSRPIDDPWRRARMNEFTPEQISAVAGFLAVVLQDERFSHYYADAELGLQKVWHA